MVNSSTIHKVSWFSDQNRPPTAEELESSQVDHFFSDKSYEDVMKLLGADYVNKQRKFVENVDTATLQCYGLIVYGQDNPIFKKYNTLFMKTCMLGRFDFGKQKPKKFECFRAEYWDYILNVGSLLKKSPKLLERELITLESIFSECMLIDSVERDRMQELTESNIFFHLPYSAFISRPKEIEILKSRYLPNTTNIEQRKIESEFMEPFIYEPKVDSEMDFDRKLLMLSQTEYLKHDIELIKGCYQDHESLLDAECLKRYSLIKHLARNIICKKEILTTSPQLTFPNIESAALLGMNRDGVCMKIFANNYEKLFPNMPYFTKYFK